MKGTRIVDLTYPIYDRMSNVWPGLPETEVRYCRIKEKEHCNELVFTMTTHSGTHIDAPSHIGLPTTLDDIPFEKLYGDGVVLDVQRGELGRITPEDLEKARPEVRENDMVLLYTGWGKLWGKRTDQEHLWKRPGILWDTADWLVKKKVKLVGIDGLAIQCPIPHPTEPQKYTGPSATEFDPKYSVHDRLLGNNIVILEGLTNLDIIVGKRLKIGVFPLPIRAADGAPVRAVAFLEE